tara:strand:+ start:424 stop:645 length:222 start_codon:yes stop_codon:yes gene_type:complete
MPFVDNKFKVGDLVKSTLHRRFTGFAIITKIHSETDLNLRNPYVSIVWQDDTREEQTCSSAHLDLVSRANEEK